MADCISENEIQNKFETTGSKRSYLMKCVVPYCSTRASTGLEKFPTDLTSRQIWLKRCGLTNVGKRARICHNHFKSSDFSTISGELKILPTASPELLLPDSVPLRNGNLTKGTYDNVLPDPLRLSKQNGENNPWAVENATVFLKFVCPECEYMNQNLESFAKHALKNHKGAQILFHIEDTDEEPMTVDIKPDVDMFIKEEIFDIDNEYIVESENMPSQEIVDPKPSIGKVKIKKKKERRKIFKCEICFIECSSVDVLKYHYSEMHMSGKSKTCSKCDFEYEGKGWYRLQEHVDRKHPDSSEKKHFCDQCNQSFIYHVTLNRHKLSHSEKIRHVCDFCGIEYLSKTNFDEHMFMKHNSKGATNLVCEVCGFSTISQMKLKTHIYTKHDVGKQKQCPHCDFKNVKIQKLHIHIDSKHSELEKKTFFCNHCPKSFAFEATLKKHMYKVKIRSLETKKRRELRAS